MSADDKTQKLKEQVEFYFSDSNLPNDKFLRSKVASHPDGYVEIELIASFKRMKELGATAEEIVKALANSELLETDDSKKLVRRKIGLVDPQLIEARTIYAKGFAGDATIDSVRDFFAKHGKVNCVRLRRFPKTKTFKGSVYVEFETAEKAQEVAKLDLELSGTKLTLMMKADHDAQKQKERQERQQKNKEEKKEEAAKPPQFVAGCVAKFEAGIDTNAAAFNEKDFKAQILTHGDAKWVVVHEGSVLVRFSSPEEAQKAVKSFAEKKEKVNDKEVTPVILTGDEETQFYVRDEEAKNAKRGGKKFARGGKTGNKRRGGFQGGRGGKKQRK